ncbi:MAG: hypothetical protein JXR37_21000 [Kiritimatiellae bacterium]|nr:hypothetical protein [Kiritimatiellia bacterium]
MKELSRKAVALIAFLVAVPVALVAVVVFTLCNGCRGPQICDPVHEDEQVRDTTRDNPPPTNRPPPQVCDPVHHPPEEQ